MCDTMMYIGTTERRDALKVMAKEKGLPVTKLIDLWLDRGMPQSNSEALQKVCLAAVAKDPDLYDEVRQLLG